MNMPKIDPSMAQLKVKGNLKKASLALEMISFIDGRFIGWFFSIKYKQKGDRSYVEYMLV
ncbi:MAG: hypothetical protein ACJAUO_001539 [Sediminicola sp.]|jgi:hypothetical protein